MCRLINLPATNSTAIMLVGQHLLELLPSKVYSFATPNTHSVFNCPCFCSSINAMISSISLLVHPAKHPQAIPVFLVVRRIIRLCSFWMQRTVSSLMCSLVFLILVRHTSSHFFFLFGGSSEGILTS